MSPALYQQGGQSDPVQGLAAIPPLKHVFEEHVSVAGADEPVEEEDPVGPAAKQSVEF